MRYWWVNHKQTFRHEFQGGYIWCPKRKRDGSHNRFYDFLRAVVPGDVIFSYASAAVRGAGVASSYCYSCPQPAEFGHIGEAWDVVGWRVDVNFQRFLQTVRPKHHLNLLAPLLEKELFPPLRLTGDGLQHIYLTTVSPAFAETILGLAGVSIDTFVENTPEDKARPMVEPQLFGQREWEDIEQQRIAKSELPSTTREALICARVGQGVFKERVARIEKACRVTFVDNPAHLIGSHIKPWRESSNEERLAGGNGLLLTPSMDHLFDRGFISFDDSGDIMISPVADATSLRRMGLDPDRPPQPVPFNTDQKFFLSHHRSEVFLAGTSS